MSESKVAHRVDEMKALASGGWSHHRIATRYCVDKSTVAYHLKGFPNQYRRYAFNEHFFDKPNLINSYWAGFILADGCIFYDKRDGTVRLVFCLAVKDKGHLEKFQLAVTSNHPLRIGKAGVSLNIYSRRWAEMLEKNFGITQKKTGKEAPPHLPRNLGLHFLRGLFDGDGTVNKKGNQARFLAGTQELMDWVVQILQSLHKVGKHKSVLVLAISGKTLRRFVQEAYEGSTEDTRMDRKYQRLQTYQSCRL